jgi:hypothetical protein
VKTVEVMVTICFYFSIHSIPMPMLKAFDSLFRLNYVLGALILLCLLVHSFAILKIPGSLASQDSPACFSILVGFFSSPPPPPPPPPPPFFLGGGGWGVGWVGVGVGDFVCMQVFFLMVLFVLLLNI